MYLHARKIRDMFKGGGSNKLYPAHNLGSLDDYKSSQLNIFRFILATKYVWEGMGFKKILKDNIQRSIEYIMISTFNHQTPA